MSYILLALKRSQIDRDVEQAAVRGAGRSSSGSARRRVWPWLVGGGLAINALVIAAVFIATRQPALDIVESPSAPVPPVETSMAVEAAKPPTEPTLAASAPVESAAKEPAPAAPTSPGPTATMPAETKTAPADGTPSGAQPGLKDPAAAARRPDAALALVQPPASVRPVGPSAARPAAPESTLVPREPSPPDVPGEPSARHRRRRAHRGEPTETPQPVPMPSTRMPGGPAEMELKIEVLVWAADPKQRMVYMNGLKYVEGQRLENGALLEQIVEDGIVVVQNGQRVRVRSDPR